MNWNDIITINGHKITVTPQPGMVVQPIGYNVWAMLGKPQCGGWAYIYNGEECYRDPVAILRCTTPVLLAPSDMYTPWDAIKACFPSVDNKAYISVQRGFIAAHAPLPDKPNVGFGYSLRVNGKSYHDGMCDMQKYGVLLDWCKLWGAE
jgi:hypothetical protein